MEDSDHQSGTLKVSRSMDHQSTQSGTRISSNEDLLTEILIRLPVTSILRFKIVCKHWQLLLSNSHLTHRYDNNLSKPFARTLLPNQNIDSPTKSIYVPFDVENRSTPPFSTVSISTSIVPESESCILVTVYYFVIPFTMVLVNIMFSIPPPSNCALEPDGGLFQIQVYSSETRTWKICMEIFSEQVSDFYPPVYCNGAVHWALDYHSGGNFLYFKLEVEQLQMLPLPVKMSYETTTMYFGESLGHLHLIFHTEYEDVLRMNVYEMLMDHSGWLVKYRVQLDERLDDFPSLILKYWRAGDFGEEEYPFQNDFQVVDLVRSKEEQDTFLVLLTAGKLTRYNFHDKSFKKLYSYNNRSLRLLNMHRYIETLSSSRRQLYLFMFFY
ncbi:F-box protein At5g07610-like [Bidens hawaiensis]|uniref:F-box protein At5g07610-like n=1 Tax=Bidens hawaiensis TaxID=980011 RepID=UPI00404B540E